MADDDGDGDRTAADRTADIARDQAVRMLVSMTVQVGVLLALSWAVQHGDDVKLRGRRLLAVARGRKEPDDTGMQLREFAVAVSKYDHGERA